jgi:hypothetical protein
VKFFICSMANAGNKKLVPLMTDNIGLLEKFAEDHDRPGRSVYTCINPLRADAVSRSKDQVACIVTLHVDIDFKRLKDEPDAIRQKVFALPLPFEIRETGGGLHVLANLKEAYDNGTEHYRRAEELRFKSDPYPRR